jgi:oxygen-independent coproporphyrinogen-3 oxidase
MPLGLYLHIPFCSAICNYCNFNRGLFDRALKDRYVEALVREIGQGRLIHGDPQDASPGSIAADAVADTIYFGGGTPSLLEPDDVRRVIRACEGAFDVALDREVTLEANPETVTAERLAAFRSAGVNRVSFGVQSLRDEELQRLSRLHGAARAREAFAEARLAAFDNVSIDLMMWLPGQRLDHWLESVDGAIALAPEHISLYMLEVYPNAPLKEEMARRRWSQAPDEDVAAMYLTAMERLEASGFEQYEISNVARPGRRARHNVKYWTDGEWIGFGCGAHSTSGGFRWKNMAGTEEYIDSVARGVSPVIDRRRLSPDERLGDMLFTGLRLAEGVDMAQIERRYAVDVWERFGRDLQPFLEEGLLKRENSRLRLTRRGMLLAHEVMAVFV